MSQHNKAEQESDTVQDDAEFARTMDNFLHCGRTGRRNALPHIMGQNATTSTAELPTALNNLSCKDSDEKGEKTPSQPGSESQQKSDEGGKS